jgi:hypothetical protein
VVSDDRPEEYCLSPEELLGAFKKYDLTIKTMSISNPPSIQLRINDNPVQFDKNQIEIKIEPGIQKIVITLEDQSDVFLSFQEGKPRLIKQKYKVKFSRNIRELNDCLIVNSELRNESPRSPRSVIPQRRSADSAEIEDEKTALSRLQGDPLFASYSPRMFTLPAIRNNPSGNRYGYLMEVQLEEELKSCQYPYGDRDAANTVNCIIDDQELKKDQTYQGKVVFKDYSIFEEEVPQMSPGPSPQQLFDELKLDRNLQAVFEEDLKFSTFYLFQASAIRSIIQATKTPSSVDTILISARTAGGKTEAFLTPITQYCIENRNKIGVKALVFYPTKALANDQTSRYIDILYHLNKRLSGRKITLGLLHGDISRNEPEPGTEDDWELPLSCPSCDKGVLRSDGNNLKCDTCGEIIDFVKIKNRQLVYSDPPDI